MKKMKPNLADSSLYPKSYWNTHAVPTLLVALEFPDLTLVVW